jgi:hypothetical protein
MRHFFTRSVPPFSRVLLVESGSRELFEKLLPVLYQNHSDMTCDLVTCYAGVPKNFRQDQGAVYRVTDYPAGPARQRFYKDLGANRYNVVGIICSAEPIMTKWKWMLAARVPAKVFVLNENGDYFWLDWGHWRVMLHFALFRAGLTGAGAVASIARLIFFPVSLAYLVLYACTVHLRRRIRSL